MHIFVLHPKFNDTTACMYYRETSMCISWIILHYCDILIFYISVILYLCARGYKCRLTTFPTRFAHGVSIL